MSGAAGVRAGAAYVEILARDGAFQSAMARVQAKMRAVAQSIQRFGTGLSLGGAALGAPLLLAARQAATFQDALLGMQAAAGLTQAEIAQLRDEALRLSQSMGVAPAKIANAFMELTKAGMSVEEVMAGAGKSAVEFARVSGVDAERAAVFMKAAMNVFGVSAQEAVDTLSAAADSSETSIAQMIESFSQVGSAGQAFNQSLFGVSQAMAALAKSNIMGEEAGTAIKTMLTKLVAPSDRAKEALATLGLSVRDFRDEAGRLLPLAQIAGVFERALGKMGGNAEDVMMAQEALVDVFQQRGIKVITAFAKIGEKGFADIAREMKAALPVSEKFRIMMEGITGQFERLQSAVNRVSIAFGDAIQPSLVKVTEKLVQLMDEVARLIAAFPNVAIAAAGVVAGMIALGTAAIAAALAIKGLVVVFAALASPIGLAVAAVAVFAYKMTNGFQDLETWGMRIAAAWKKVGVYVASVFDQDVRDNMAALIKQIDDDLARWEVANERKKQDAANRVPPGNDVNPDEFRDPLGGADPPRGDQKIVSAGTFGSSEGLGIGPELNKLQQVADHAKRGADGIEQLVQMWKDNPREPQGKVIDAVNGEPNPVPPMVNAPADLPWWAPRDAFEDLVRRSAAGDSADAADSLGAEHEMRHLPTDPAILQQAADAMAGPAMSFEEAAREMGRASREASASRAAEAAEAASRSVSAVQQPLPAIEGGLSSVADACRQTAAATIANGRVLERMIGKLDSLQGAFA